MTSFTEKSSCLSSRFSESMLFPFCSMTLDFPPPFLCHDSRPSLDHWNSLPVSLLFFCSLFQPTLLSPPQRLSEGNFDGPHLTENLCGFPLPLSHQAADCGWIRNPSEPLQMVTSQPGCPPVFLG